jgi:hypothetical protein
MPGPGGDDLTARLSALREVLHIEVAAAAALLNSRIDGVDAQREVLLGGVNSHTQSLQDQMDRRLDQFQLQVDQRFEASKEPLVALKEMLNERYATQTKALDAAFKAAEQAVQTALVSAEKAVGKAETAADKRFDSVNEFRQTLSDQTATFLPRGEYDAAYKALADQITAGYERLAAVELRLTSRLDRGDGNDAGTASSRAEHRLNGDQLIQALIFLIAVAAVVVAILKK